jgi:molecular chaperone GrpE
MVIKQASRSFDSLGVSVIEALNKEFDPNFHNAVMHIEDEKYGKNVICEEFLKGYKIGDKVISHSIVKVAN